MRSLLSSLLSQIGPDWLDLSALELEKIAIFNLVYTLTSTDINPLAPNWVKIYMTIRSWMISFMGLKVPIAAN